MIYIIGIFTSLFLSIIILTKKGNNIADRILGIWMVLIALHLFAYFSYITKLPYHMSFVGINIPLPFLHGPFLYIYTLALCNPGRLKAGKLMIHIILPAVILLIVLPFSFLPSNEKLDIIEGNSKSSQLFSSALFMLLTFSAVYYVLITNKLLSEHRKRILNHFSSQERINLNWLRILFYGMALLWILIIFIRDDRWIFSAGSLFVVYMGYFGIKQAGIFTNKTIISDNELEPGLVSINPEDTVAGRPPQEKRKYAKSGLNTESSRSLHRELTLLMESEKLYTDAELTLFQLSSILKCQPNHLSQVINESEGVNFYDYINNLRIEEFKRLVLLPENQRFTLLSIAFECGFNSKSTFNRFFKKNTNLSPSEYIKKQRII